MSFLRRASALTVLVSFLFTAAAAASHAQAALTPDQARAIVAPLYDALDRPATKNVQALLLKAGTPNWLSCSGEGTCVPLSVNAQHIEDAGKMVPDLRFRIVDLIVSGNTVVVRSEATGRPVGEFFGKPTNGRSFKIMTIDIHTISNGKIVRSYHVEDWFGALRQVAVTP